MGRTACRRTTPGAGWRRVGVAVLAAAVLGTTAACAGGDESAPTPPASSDPWADIDTTMPSEDPAGTVYGYVQAMAAGDSDRACRFQYRGSSDWDDDACVLADEQPPRDAGWPASRWATLAAHPLDDYRPREDARGWLVALPDEPAARWRIRQDDAGIWFIR